MHELNVNEISEVNGGASLFALGTLVTILIHANKGLNDLGSGLGDGFYDATH